MKDQRTGYGEVWTPKKLSRLKKKELMDIWHSLPAPAFSEMDGEYEAEILDQGPVTSLLSRAVLYMPVLHGTWLGKAFTPAGKSEGHGYNAFRSLGRVRRKYRMKTQVAPSTFDGRDAFTLIYDAYDSLCGMIHMRDEVRKVADGLYLGVGTWGFTDGMRQKNLPFVLSGPVGPFTGSDREEAKQAE
ncbi:MAG: hypothetical protein ABIM40_16825 [Pseudomonadota bacterium]